VSLAPAVIIERLALIGRGNAEQGFRELCAAARICSICCQSYADTMPYCGCPR